MEDRRKTKVQLVTELAAELQRAKQLSDSMLSHVKALSYGLKLEIKNVLPN